MKPHLVRAPDDVTVQSGDTASFACSVSGDPAPGVTWHREDPDAAVSGAAERVETVAGPRATVDRRTGRLRLADARPEDEGVYVCRAENEAGRVEASATLSVHGKGAFALFDETMRYQMHGS